MPQKKPFRSYLWLSFQVLSLQWLQTIPLKAVAHAQEAVKLLVRKNVLMDAIQLVKEVAKMVARALVWVTAGATVWAAV